MGRRDRPTKPAAKGFNTPFKALAGARKPSPAPVARPAPPPPKPAAPPAADEDLLFSQAMAGVDRIADPHGLAPPPAPRPARVTDDDAEALARLSELVSGDGPFDIADTDEFLEGVAAGVDKRLLASLRRGDFALQGHLDLHGMTRPDAKEAVERFLGESLLKGDRCVLIVHGRGLNSKDQIPVLKAQLAVWLRRGRIGKAVLAFATARPHDGGAGALYVLLRR
jgi:DNA-nicking Smr family endonuclease